MERFIKGKILFIRMDSPIEKTLENLVTINNSLNKRIITGFNYHPICLQVDDLTILTFSNIHSYPNYLMKVIEDLRMMGYPNDEVSITTRDKKGYFKWMPDFFIRSEDGNLEEYLRIKNIKTEVYLDLEKIPYQTLEEASYSEEDADNLIAENEGFEINISLLNEEDLHKLAVEFLRKSSKKLYDECGEVVFETKEEYGKRNPWPGAWDVPVLIIGGHLSQIQHSIPGFQNAFLFRFQDVDIGEYNFVINKQIKFLKMSEQYKHLQDLGFKQEPCLANIRFIKDYVDVL